MVFGRPGGLQTGSAIYHKYNLSLTLFESTFGVPAVVIYLDPFFQSKGKKIIFCNDFTKMICGCRM